MAMEDQARAVLLVGVQDSGKTNFLSRFWLSLEAGGGILTKAKLPADLDYLQAGADHLLKGEFAAHTPYGDYKKTEIPVKTTAPGDEFFGTLVVPDLSGERVLSAFQTRQWSDEWEDQIRMGCSCLLFVRVDSPELIAPLDWMNCVNVFNMPIAEATSKMDQAGGAKPPTQVVLVDWLQFLRQAFTDRVNGEYKPRIGVVVAAWDLAPADQKAAGPEAWVRANLPLLWQFIRTNDDKFVCAYFGVSVASGDFVADPVFKASYLKGDPLRAGEVIHSLRGALASANDITLPVAWALGLVAVKSDGNGD
jgi:Double-GTPase 1